MKIAIWALSVVKRGFDIYFYVWDPNTCDLTVHCTFEFAIFELQIFFRLWSNAIHVQRSSKCNHLHYIKYILSLGHIIIYCRKLAVMHSTGTHKGNPL